MSIVEITYYQAVCDCCDLNLSDDGGDYSAWSDANGARETAGFGMEWIWRGQSMDLCEDCATDFLVDHEDEQDDIEKGIAWIAAKRKRLREKPDPETEGRSDERR